LAKNSFAKKMLNVCIWLLCLFVQKGLGSGRRNDYLVTRNLAVMIKIGKNTLKNDFISQIWI
jgi:hypothetical protein